MRGYLKAWRQNLRILIALLILIAIFALVVHFAAHKGHAIPI